MAYWYFDVSYPAMLYFGSAGATDNEIEKIVGQEAGASGMGFGKRDLTFYFDAVYGGRIQCEKARAALLAADDLVKTNEVTISRIFREDDG